MPTNRQTEGVCVISHTTTLKGVQIRDTNALAAAVAELAARGIKCRLEQNVRPRMYYGNQHGVCPYVLKLDNAPYDVGFDRQEDGSFLPVMDTWAGHIQREIGVTNPACELPKDHAEREAMMAIGRLSQTYAKHAAINAAAAQGYIVDSASTDEKGNIHLVLSGM